MLAICKVLCQACDILGYKSKWMSVNINDINYYKITTEVTINSRSVLHPIMKKKMEIHPEDFKLHL